MTSAEDLLAEITDPSMRERLSSIRQGIQERQKRRPQKPKSAEIVQLPLWPEPARGVPNSALRGALFAAIQGKGRQFIKKELLAVQEGIQITFTGEQLNQNDLDVWETALHISQVQKIGLGNICRFSARSFLKLMGRHTGKSQHEQLESEITRLTACEVELREGRYVFGGSLIQNHARDEDSKFYCLELNPRLQEMYDAGWTAIDWQQRQQLRNKPLAQWLHGFYATHATPFPLRVEYLRQLSGSKTKSLQRFKQALMKALEDLKAIGIILDFEIKDGLVYVERMPSTSQKKHLTRANPRKK